MEPLFLIRLEIDDEFCDAAKIYQQNFADMQYIASFLHGAFGNPSCYFAFD